MAQAWVQESAQVLAQGSAPAWVLESAQASALAVARGLLEGSLALLALAVVGLGLDGGADKRGKGELVEAAAARAAPGRRRPPGTPG